MANQSQDFRDIESPFSTKLRRVIGTNIYVSKCGHHYSTVNHPHIIVTMTRNPYSEYLSCGADRHMHAMVARAWVYNPCPRKFHWVDHIDGDKQNNHATNLRWVSPTLNGLNKKRTYGKKQTRKYKSGRVGVFYKTTVTVGGKTEQLTSGDKDDLERITRAKINEAFMSRYNANVEEFETPPRADYLTYWRDDTDEPVMRPRYLDIGVQRDS